VWDPLGWLAVGPMPSPEPAGSAVSRHDVVILHDLWLAAGEYRGPVLIRGRQVSGEGRVRLA
jgi:hypothetical protein